MTCGIDIVLNDEEVSREAHRLHDMELEVQSFGYLLRQGVAIYLLSPDIRKMRKVVGFELKAVKLAYAAHSLNLLLCFLLAHYDIAVLVACEFVEQFLVGVLLPVLFLRTELFGNLEVRHDGGVVDVVCLDLVQYLAGVGQRFRDVGKKVVHLLTCLEPLLLGV